MKNPYKQVAELVGQNQMPVLVTKIPENKGKTYELSREILTEEEGRIQEVREAAIPMLCDEEEGTVFYEPFYPRERLIVLGGGHIALPLVEIASRVGFAVTVVDDRPSFANTARFPLAEQVLCESFPHAIEQLSLTRNDFIVIITRGHKHDADCLRQLLSREETIYIGMIGSKRRVAIVKEELEQEGFDAARLSRVATPIGLSIGAVTPEEISISIIAQLIERKRLTKSREYLISRSDFDDAMFTQFMQLDKPCALVTILTHKGSVPRGTGAKMLVFETGDIIGSIGGGCSEAAVLHKAMRMIGTGTYEVVPIDLTKEKAEDEGMVCGGVMSVLIEDY